jgi:hypothetical protein
LNGRFLQQWQAGWGTLLLLANDRGLAGYLYDSFVVRQSWLATTGPDQLRVLAFVALYRPLVEPNSPLHCHSGQEDRVLPVAGVTDCNLLVFTARWP